MSRTHDSVSWNSASCYTISVALGATIGVASHLTLSSVAWPVDTVVDRGSIHMPQVPRLGTKMEECSSIIILIVDRLSSRKEEGLD